MPKSNTPAPSTAAFKRVTFSLTDQISEEIDRLSLIPRGFRASRSDVVRAGVAALAAMPEEQLVALLDKVRRE
jgi:Arc/MetJ-type ribon-helix-helix transcriptional regulator